MKRKDFILISALIMAGAPLTSKAQFSKSALDYYMLQRPQVTKSYKDKKFMDHLFMDFGFGGNLMGRHNVKLGPTAEIGLGDWISPEHGVRLNFYGGAYKIGGKETKYASVGLDYLLNITAIAQPGIHYSQQPFEVYGIAGVDLSYSRKNKHNDHGFGAHMGLRGQYAFTPITYVYAETRVGVTQDNVAQVQTWRNLHPMQASPWVWTSVCPTCAEATCALISPRPTALPTDSLPACRQDPCSLAAPTSATGTTTRA